MFESEQMPAHGSLARTIVTPHSRGILYMLSPEALVVVPGLQSEQISAPSLS